MVKEIAPGILAFTEDDQEFIEWCHANCDGFIYNCRRNASRIFPYMLHAAIRKGDLCQHFRNRNRASGYEPPLTTGAICKVGSLQRSSLERSEEEHTSELQSLRHLVCRLL